MSKVSVEVEEGSYAWAVAMEVQGNKMECKWDALPGPDWHERLPTSTSSNTVWRMAPIAPVEELIKMIRSQYGNQIQGYDCAFFERLCAAVEAKLATKKDGGR
jgi:hypothetical protein